MLIVTLIVGVFPAIFAAILSLLLRRFGSWAFLAAPFVWVFTEFLRYWVTGNNWNAIGYSQAFPTLDNSLVAEFGGYIVWSWFCRSVPFKFLLISKPSFVTVLSDRGLLQLFFGNHRFSFGCFFMAVFLHLWERQASLRKPDSGKVVASSPMFRWPASIPKWGNFASVRSKWRKVEFGT